MPVDDGHMGGMLPGPHPGVDVQIGDIFPQGAGKVALLHQLLGTCDVLRRDLFQNLQLTLRVSAHHTQDRGHAHALKAPGVGHCDALYIFKNISAAADLDVLREFPQDGSCFGRGIGDRDRFGTSQGRDQLAFQDIDIIGLLQRIHSDPSFLSNHINSIFINIISSLSQNVKAEFPPDVFPCNFRPV